MTNPETAKLIEAIKHVEEIDNAIRNGDVMKVYRMRIPPSEAHDSDFMVKRVIDASKSHLAPTEQTGVACWHDDIPEAIAHVESLTIERMEQAITACQDWDEAGLINKGCVTDMATAYLEQRKNTTPTERAEPVTPPASMPDEIWCFELGNAATSEYGVGGDIGFAHKTPQKGATSYTRTDLCCPKVQGVEVDKLADLIAVDVAKQFGSTIMYDAKDIVRAAYAKLQKGDE